MVIGEGVVETKKQLLAVAVAELRDEVAEAGIIGVGHRVFLGEYLVVLTKSQAMAYLTGGSSPLLPPHHGTHTPRQHNCCCTRSETRSGR